MRSGWYVEMAREWDDGAGLDAVIESLWKEGMQKADALTVVAARAMWERQQAEQAERERKENAGEPVEPIKPGSRKKLRDMAAGAFARVFFCALLSMADVHPLPALRARQLRRPRPRCSARPSPRATSPLSRPDHNSRQARSRLSGRRSSGSTLRVGFGAHSPSRAVTDPLVRTQASRRPRI